MKYKIKKNHIFLFLVVAICLALVSYFSYKTKLEKSGRAPILAYKFDCATDKIDQAILNLHENTILIGAYIDFDRLPDDKISKDVLERGEIELDERSQLFEISPKIYAKIPTKSMCDLLALDIVKYVSIPANNNRQENEIK